MELGCGWGAWSPWSWAAAGLVAALCERVLSLIFMVMVLRRLAAVPPRHPTGGSGPSWGLFRLSRVFDQVAGRVGAFVHTRSRLCPFGEGGGWGRRRSTMAITRQLRIMAISARKATLCP